ncbi:hypothetical protein [Roseovarius dicentrarchi]|uniref:hypothetical protein n=1 Tax=Roseovarius dicentrarchi TaxID=2250573 RepID=UPI000DEA2D3A|nr:hypothetical protein [Roseovarius dicentrarchi]
MNNPSVSHTEPTSGERSTKSSENMVAAKIILVIVLALVAWGASVFIWGVPGLYIPALALVPVIWIALVWITLGQ